MSQVKELMRDGGALRAERDKSFGAKEELLSALRATKIELSRCVYVRAV